MQQKKSALAVLALSLSFAGASQATTQAELVQDLYTNPVVLCQQQDNSQECVRQLERMLSWMTPSTMQDVNKAVGDVPALRGLRSQDVAMLVASALVETDRGRTGSIYGVLAAGNKALEEHQPMPIPAGLVVQFSDEIGATVYKGAEPYYTPFN